VVTDGHTVVVDRAAAEAWIRTHVLPAGPVQTAQVRPWSTILRVPLEHGTAWLKACGPLQAFEPRLTAALFARWPNRVPVVLACNEDRSWLLLADAGTRLADLGNPPGSWLTLLPLYAEMQQAEAIRVGDHLEHGVPDLRVPGLVSGYEDLLRQDLPLEAPEIARLRSFASRFEELCAELSTSGIPETIQHDDLHMNNVYIQDGTLRVLDWGDSCVSYPFASLVATFRFLEERNGLTSEDQWFGRLRDAYLEPWGAGLIEVFDLAMRVGGVAHAIASLRQRRALSGQARAEFDEDFATRLRRGLARAL
jgi:hypothetical protein